MADELSIQIDEILRTLASSSPDYRIVRVPVSFRNVNERAYEPVRLAIGPYYRGKDYLNFMEEHKRQYLNQLLQRRGENSDTTYRNAIRALEERARNCYAEPVSLETEEFVEMMLLDSCFITELLCKYWRRESGEENDHIIKSDLMMKSVRRDLLLTENQIPFFVLREFFGLVAMPNEQNLLPNMIFAFFSDDLPGSGYAQYSEDSTQEIKHLLGILHDNCRPPPSIGGREENVTGNDNWENIPCATKLQEAGIKFKKVEGGSLFDIKFENGTMEIPRILVDVNTESFFRSLIVYEQFSQNQNLNYVIDYTKLMGCIIRSPEDVELLSKHGIIRKRLGDDEVVANVFKRLDDFVVVSSPNCYSKVFVNVNEHCSKGWNNWMAILRPNNFNDPRELIPFLVPVLLLVFAMVRAVFSVLTYFKKENVSSTRGRQV